MSAKIQICNYDRDQRIVSKFIFYKRIGLEHRWFQKSKWLEQRKRIKCNIIESITCYRWKAIKWL